MTKKDKEYLATAAYSVASVATMWAIVTFLLTLLLG